MTRKLIDLLEKSKLTHMSTVKLKKVISSDTQVNFAEKKIPTPNSEK